MMMSVLNSQLHCEVEGVAIWRRRSGRLSSGVLGRTFKTLLRITACSARGNPNQRPTHISRTSPQQNLQVRTFSNNNNNNSNNNNNNKEQVTEVIRYDAKSIIGAVSW